jgi:hypothetical protein
MTAITTTEQNISWGNARVAQFPCSEVASGDNTNQTVVDYPSVTVEPKALAVLNFVERAIYAHYGDEAPHMDDEADHGVFLAAAMCCDRYTDRDVDAAEEYAPLGVY